MKTSASLLLISLLFALPASATVETNGVESNCWDGSFAYQVVTLARDSGRVEVGFRAGLSLRFNEPPSEIVDLNDLPVLDIDTPLYLSFAEDQCQSQEDGVLLCEADAGNKWRLRDAIFVEREIDNLGDKIFTISEVRADHITARIGEDHVEVSITKERGRSLEPAVLNVSFGFLHCDTSGIIGGTHFGIANFPASLKSYLNSLGT